ncbi:hypothetical protein ACSU1N_04835 [Thermogladius sp. 4427co]|uniref:hypothetical protein n=1 Tax=Thermogladius sp. 4427co TaxID=3450718 RepID=UPI003F795A95
MDDNVLEKSRRFYQLETTSYNFSVNISSGLANALALRLLGFNALEISILTTTRIFSYALSQVPALINPSFIKKKRKTLWNVGGIVNRIGLSLAIFGVFLAPPYNFYYLLGLTTSTQIAGGIAGVSAGDLLGDLVDINEAPVFWTRINKLIYIATILSFLVGSLTFIIVKQLLIAYLIVYSIALGAAVFSSIMLVMIEDPRRNTANYTNSLNKHFYTVNTILDKNILKYLGVQLLFNYSVNIPAPFWDYLVLNVLNGNEVIIMIKNMAGLISKFVSINKWKNRLMNHGSRPTLSIGMVSTSFVPIAYIASVNPWMTILAETYSGYAWSSLDLTSAIYTFYLTSDEVRPVFISISSLSSNLIASIGAFTGSILVSMTGNIYAPFLVSSIMRVFSGGVAYKIAPELNSNRNKSR